MRGTGGLSGLGLGTVALDRLGQMYEPFKSHGGYGGYMGKVIGGEHGSAKSWPARIALSLLLSAPFLASTAAGQHIGGQVAESMNPPKKV